GRGLERGSARRAAEACTLAGTRGDAPIQLGIVAAYGGNVRGPAAVAARNLAHQAVAPAPQGGAQLALVVLAHPAVADPRDQRVQAGLQCRVLVGCDARPPLLLALDEDVE